MSTRSTIMLRRRLARGLHYRDMLAMFARLRLPVVDGHAAFEDVGRPSDMFYYPGSHYSPAGYPVSADALLRVLTVRFAAAAAGARLGEFAPD